MKCDRESGEDRYENAEDIGVWGNLLSRAPGSTNRN